MSGIERADAAFGETRGANPMLAELRKRAGGATRFAVDYTRDPKGTIYSIKPEARRSGPVLAAARALLGEIRGPEEVTLDDARALLHELAE